MDEERRDPPHEALPESPSATAPDDAVRRRLSSRPPSNAGTYSISLREKEGLAPQIPSQKPLKMSVERKLAFSSTLQGHAPAKNVGTPAPAPDEAPVSEERRSSPPPAREFGGDQPRNASTISITTSGTAIDEGPEIPEPPRTLRGQPTPTMRLGSDTRGPRIQSEPPPAFEARESEAPPPPTSESDPEVPVPSSRRPGPPVIGSVSAPPGYQPPSTLFAAEEHAELAGELHARSLTHCLAVVVSSEAKHLAHRSLLLGRLAILLARKCQPRVLVLEADFDRPMAHEVLRLEMPHGQGFSRQLKHRAIGRPKKPWTVRTTGPFLDLLGESRVRCPGMLRSSELESALGELRTEYDVILVSAPSVEHSVEMRALSAICDAALFAVPLGEPKGTGAALIEYLFPQRFTQAVEVTGRSTRRD